MQFHILTIFPGFFASIFEHGILHRAIETGRVSVHVHDLRAFTHDRHRTVDDRPFGGGEGMVLKAEPIAEALASIGIGPKATRKPGEQVILLSAQGRVFSQPLARELAAEGLRDFGTEGPESATTQKIIFMCGRYEGVDERINQLYVDLELSIGDYVLSGGELAAAIVIDSVTRLIPGVLGNQASGEFESFGPADALITSDEAGVPRSQHGAGGLLDYPHFTRPAEFEGVTVPEVLLNGDHLQIRRWRREEQLRKTLQNRPDLLARAALSPADEELLKKLRAEAAGEHYEPPAPKRRRKKPTVL